MAIQNNIVKKLFILAFTALLFLGNIAVKDGRDAGMLRVSANRRFFMTADGKPFFWLGDTGWLLFSKLTRQEADTYLEDRRKKGFNVIQVMVLHNVNAVNAYGDTALVHQNVATPFTTPGSDFTDAAQYDYWDHIDYIIGRAAAKGICMALVPVWGSNVKEGMVNRQQAGTYAAWLAERYRHHPNIIWLNGGDIKGSDSMQVWNTIGSTLREKDPGHLISFHPYGRTTSSTWFHRERWLDFNMFQSGHRSYAQDTSAGEHRFGPDNYRFLQIDYPLQPVKPTLDGEPAYEEIPYGLHDTTQPRWTDNDVRRYGYWEVFAGGAGYTYGHNSVMQMRRPADKIISYGAHFYWYDAIGQPGAGQMTYLKKLMLSRPYFERVPDQSLVANQGAKYDYIAATRAEGYAFIYSYTGRNIMVNMGKITGTKVRASWYSPRDGSEKPLGDFANKGQVEFNPPGEPKDGNDWVLMLDTISL